MGGGGGGLVRMSREKGEKRKKDKEREEGDRDEPVWSSCASSSPTGVLRERHKSLNSAERGTKRGQFVNKHRNGETK